MSSVPVTYEQPIDAHYTTVLARYFQRTNEPPPEGWQRAVLHLSPDATHIDVREEDEFMEELLRLIREQCSTTDPRKTNLQGLWIKGFDSSKIVNRHLQGSCLKVYSEKSTAQQVWIDVASAAGSFGMGDVFRS